MNAKALEDLEKSGTTVQPSPATIALIQDKFAQKEHFAAKGIPMAPYMKTDSVAEVLAAGEKMGFPLMLKARGNSYDGKGNYVVKTAADAEAAFKSMAETSDRGCYAEGWADFEMELAVMVVKGANSEVHTSSHRPTPFSLSLSPPPAPFPLSLWGTGHGRHSQVRAFKNA